MKIAYKTGLLSAALVMGALAFGADALAYGTTGKTQTQRDYSYDRGYTGYSDRTASRNRAMSAEIIPASELPINRGVGRGSNKGMLDLNRGYGTAVVTDPSTGYTPPADRDRYYGAMPASSNTSWNSERRQPAWRSAPQGSSRSSMSRTRTNTVGSDVYTNPAIGEGSNRASSGLDNETR